MGQVGFWHVPLPSTIPEEEAEVGDHVIMESARQRVGNLSRMGVDWGAVWALIFAELWQQSVVPTAKGAVSFVIDEDDQRALPLT